MYQNTCIVFLTLKIEFALANSTDHNGMQHNAAFNRVLQYLPTFLFRVSCQQRAYNDHRSLYAYNEHRSLYALTPFLLNSSVTP